MKVEGLGKLLKALEEEPSGPSGSRTGSGTGLTDEKEGEEAGRRGVVTICNHTSVVDDPMVSRCPRVQFLFTLETGRGYQAVG